MLIRGSCHCGNISFALTWDPDPAQIPARACTCSFCSKHAGTWTSHPDATLKISVEDESRVSKYAFGTQTADFLVCATCGVAPVVLSAIEGRLFAVVNVNAFDGVEHSCLRTISASFEEEGERSRLPRRKRNWIADVEYRTKSGTSRAARST